MRGVNESTEVVVLGCFLYLQHADFAQARRHGTARSPSRRLQTGKRIVVLLAGQAVVARECVVVASSANKKHPRALPAALLAAGSGQHPIAVTSTSVMLVPCVCVWGLACTKSHRTIACRVGCVSSQRQAD
ncbi:hypothetical protein GQ54DRAFT_83158 [Martensiomyces pterosporus]|nr:hypothetical protein GQ54DRAFT_83158 [Martensiomyces pterosporus]